MLKVTKFVTPSPAQWGIVIDGMRNPKNSWDKSDSYITHFENPDTLEICDYQFYMDENDHDLSMRLAKGGSVHAKYRRMLPVIFTVEAPLYWWKEMETYRTGVAPNPTDLDFNSCSTMHKITEKEFTMDDFSCGHLCELNIGLEEFPVMHDFEAALKDKIAELNLARKGYLRYKDTNPELAEKFWWQIIQLLPTSYNQKRTISTNYEALSAMWYWRHNHKQYEWRQLCEWIESLPYSEIITLMEQIDKMDFPAAWDDKEEK